jgi:hypothetical protein
LKDHERRKNYSGEIARLLDASQPRNRLAKKVGGFFVGKLFSERVRLPDELGGKLGFETAFDLFNAFSSV